MRRWLLLSLVALAGCVGLEDPGSCKRARYPTHGHPYRECDNPVGIYAAEKAFLPAEAADSWGCWPGR